MMRKKLLLAIVALGFSISALADKTDIVVLKNGDRVTGEVIKLEVGVLEFNTDTMGRIFIEWRFISDVISATNQSLETIDGTRWVGQLRKPDEGDNIIVDTIRGPIELEPAEVVAAWPVEQTFKDKIDFDISMGIDYSKATDISNFLLAADFRHRTHDRLTEALLRMDITRQDVGEDQTRNEFKLDHQYLLANRKFRTWLFGIDTNEALQLDMRVSIGATVGNYFKKTNNTWFTASAGAQVVYEEPVGGSAEEELEAVLSARYRFFRFADPERNFDTSLNIYPSITDWGRIRADIRSTFKLEFIQDLFWAFELYGTYDNDPLIDDAENADFGVTSTFGWSY